MAVVEVTETIKMAVVGDRLHCTVISGDQSKTYAVSFHKARAAIHVATRLLEREAGEHVVLPIEIPPKHG